jgi:hypothetical protein
MDMNPVSLGDDAPYIYKDAIILSGHKFIGGPGTVFFVIGCYTLLSQSLHLRIRHENSIPYNFTPISSVQKLHSNLLLLSYPHDSYYLPAF